MIVAALVTLLLIQDDPARLADQLRSDDVEVRLAASDKLQRLGERVRAVLEKLEKDPKPETAGRAAYLLRILDLKGDLSPRLLKAIPDAAERLAMVRDKSWTEVFLQATARDSQGLRVYPDLVPGDVSPLLARAFRGAELPNDKSMICTVAGFWRLKEALPHMEKWLTDPNMHVRGLAASWFLDLGGPEAAGRVAPFLRDPERTVRIMVAEKFSLQGSKTQARALLAAASDEHPLVRQHALQALGKSGDLTVIPAIAELLDTPTRGAAALCLANLGASDRAARIAKIVEGGDFTNDPGNLRDLILALGILDTPEHAEAIKKHVDHGDGGIRGAAVSVLAAWGMEDGISRLAKLAGDRDTSAQAFVLPVLGGRGGRRSVDLLISMLKSSAPHIKAGAARELARVGDPSSLGSIEPLLRDPLPWVRWPAALAIGNLASRLEPGLADRWIAALKTAEADPSEPVRFAASIALIRMKAMSRAEQADAVRRLRDANFHHRWSLVSEMGLALAQAHEPAGHDALLRDVTLRKPVDSVEGLASALSEAGLRLTDRDTLIVKGRLREDTVRRRPHDLIVTMIEPWPGFFIEKDSVRLIPREAALELWLKRLEDSK